MRTYGTGSIKRIGKGRWRVQVSCGLDPFTGKRNRPTATVEGTRADAEREAQRLLASGGRVSGGKVPFDVFVEQHYFPNISVRERTLDGYKSKWKHHIKPALGNLTLDDVTAYAITQMLKRSSASNATKRHVWRVTMTMLNTAREWGFIDAVPRVKRPVVEQKPIAVLSAQQMRALLAHFRGHALEPIVALALGAGLRRSELAALLWSDVDFDVGSVSITKGAHQANGKVWVEAPKSEQSRRVIALDDVTLGILKTYRGVGRIWAGTPHMMTNQYHTHLVKQTKDGPVYALGFYVPLKNLRHTHITAVVESVGLAAAQQRAGHSTPAITATIYTGPLTTADMRAAKAMGELLAIPFSADESESGRNQ